MMTAATTTTTTALISPTDIWTAALGQLQIVVRPANYETWLRDTVGLRFDDGCFVVGTQNAFVSEWLQVRMRNVIVKTLSAAAGRPVDVAFEVLQPADDLIPPALVADARVDDEVPAFFRRTFAPPPLQPALTFAAFVIGEENRMAAQAARCAAAPGGVQGTATPLVIFGTSGLGKTHLLHAIGHAALAHGRAVIYATAERFGNDYVRALPGQIEGFRRRYRQCDVLLIDDVQFLEGKEKFQEEFFHSFNDLHAAGKQIVIAVDRPPSQLRGLTEQLRSRLQWGLQTDLQTPGFTTRLAILRDKVRRQAQKLPDGVLELIAERCCPSVRELEGYLCRVLHYLPQAGARPLREHIAQTLSMVDPGAAADSGAAPDADGVIAAVCRRTGKTPGDLRGRSRNREITYARHLAMYVMREDGGLSVAEIGRGFNRDHSTVIDGIKRIAMEKTTRPETAADLEAVRRAGDPSPPAAPAIVWAVAAAAS